MTSYLTYTPQSYTSKYSISENTTEVQIAWPGAWLKNYCNHLKNFKMLTNNLFHSKFFIGILVSINAQ